MRRSRTQTYDINNTSRQPKKDVQSDFHDQNQNQQQDYDIEYDKLAALPYKILPDKLH